MIVYLLNAILGILPVSVFLAALVHFDTFKLVPLKTVIFVTALGAAAAIASYFANGAMLAQVSIGFENYRLYGAPLIEEILKALIIIALMRTNRIGFAFDAAILGFAVGAGFAVVENFYYLQVLGVDQTAVWTIRGFGTAIMHGGVTAIFAMTTHLLTVTQAKPNPFFYIPGYIIAITIHSGFNYFLEFPVTSTISVMLIQSAVLAVLLRRDKKSIHDWIAVDFDHHRILLAQIRSGNFSEGKLGKLINELRKRFDTVIVDKIISYIELHTELVLAAEEILIAHERGEKTVVSKEMKEKIASLDAAESEIGKTSHLVLRAHLQFSRHEFWELYMLEKEAGFKHPHVHGVE